MAISSCPPAGGVQRPGSRPAAIPSQAASSLEHARFAAAPHQEAAATAVVAAAASAPLPPPPSPFCGASVPGLMSTSRSPVSHWSADRGGRAGEGPCAHILNPRSAAAQFCQANAQLQRRRRCSRMLEPRAGRAGAAQGAGQPPAGGRHSPPLMTYTWDTVPLVGAATDVSIFMALITTRAWAGRKEGEERKEGRKKGGRRPGGAPAGVGRRGGPLESRQTRARRKSKKREGSGRKGCWRCHGGSRCIHAFTPPSPPSLAHLPCGHKVPRRGLHLDHLPGHGSRHRAGVADVGLVASRAAGGSHRVFALHGPGQEAGQQAGQSASGTAGSVGSSACTCQELPSRHSTSPAAPRAAQQAQHVASGAEGQPSRHSTSPAAPRGSPAGTARRQRRHPLAAGSPTRSLISTTRGTPSHSKNTCRREGKGGALSGGAGWLLKAAAHAKRPPALGSAPPAVPAGPPVPTHLPRAIGLQLPHRFQLDTDHVARHHLHIHLWARGTGRERRGRGTERAVEAPKPGSRLL